MTNEYFIQSSLDSVLATGIAAYSRTITDNVLKVLGTANA